MPPVPDIPQPARPRRTRRRIGPLVLAVSMVAGAVPPPVHAQNALPALGDPSGEDFSVGTERQLGAEIMREIRADPDYLDDPLLLEYIEGLWQPLVAQARVRGNLTSDIDAKLAWEPFLVRDREVNAFALPGGYVGVNLGLIAMTATPDELASVLAHEMSHITQRHIARSIGNSKRTTLLSLATMLAGLVIAAKAGKNSGADAANAAIIGGQALGAQGQLNFSRDMEREADRVGWQVMTGAGFAPDGMALMFEKLEHASRLNDFGNYPYLRSHPLTSERIGEARARMGTTPNLAAGATRFSVLEHVAAEARARVLMDTRVDALQRWQALDGVLPAAGSGSAAVVAPVVGSTVNERLLNACSSALASTLLRDWKRADRSLGLALGLVRGSPRSDARAERAVVLLAAQAYLARGDVPRALAAVQPYRDDGSRPVLLLEAQAALTPGGDTTTVKLRADQLQTWVAGHPNDALAWTDLGLLQERLGQPLRALRADAESRVALGDLSGAVDRLNAGQRRARSGGPVDFIDVSVIDARLRDLQQQLKRQRADERASR